MLVPVENLDTSVNIRNAKRLRKLTENILDATKIESQSLKVNKQEQNLISSHDNRRLCHD
jgi:K+-sensing histidine kinase KdpD